GTVVLQDQCNGNAACAAIPTAPSPLPSGQGLLETRLQFGYLYSYSAPTWLSIYAFGPDAAPFGTTLVHGGEPIRIDLALLEPNSGWSGTGTAEGVNVYRDNVKIASTTAP